MKHIALIGLRATGKSTIGPLLAKRLQVPFLDLDQAPVQAAGLDSIIEVIRTRGKEWFSQTEHAILKRTLEGNERTVISTGGRTISHEFPELKSQNRTLLNTQATVVLLTAREEELWSRIQADQHQSHSHLSEEALRANFDASLDQLALYESVADHIIATDKLTPKETVQIIIDALKS